MPRFEPGDKVIGNDKAARYGVTTTGWEGVVRATWISSGGEYIEVRGPDREKRQTTFSVLADHFDPETPPFDPQKPVRTRDGQQVTFMRRFNDLDRPFSATITVGDHEFTLTYDAHGRFCPYGKSPVDLING